MEYTNELTLCKITITQDSIGQNVQTETKREIMANESVVGTKEFYNAMAVGIRPTAELLVRKLDYDNETEVIYNGIRYSVIRTINKGKQDIMLVIGIKEGKNG